MPDLNPTAASLLGFLLRGPQTGWDIVQSVEGSVGYFWNLTRSQVYRELKSLADAGLVSLGESGPRDRQPYAITRAGREAFARWIAKEPGDETQRFPFLLTVFFGNEVDPARLRAFAASFRARHAKRLTEYEALDCQVAEMSPFEREALRFGRIYERAVLEWIDSAPWASNTDTAPKPSKPVTRRPAR